MNIAGHPVVGIDEANAALAAEIARAAAAGAEDARLHLQFLNDAGYSIIRGASNKALAQAAMAAIYLDRWRHGGPTPTEKES